ncbi:MAG: hypothetical protein JO137_01950 [Hyphomicrobiales bacterium]|nr:hypothetical protein [Hyphomicrobiales bacterium]MBV9430562.1 hypothetical protein [Hyphomicrobiales bacterium]
MDERKREEPPQRRRTPGNEPGNQPDGGRDNPFPARQPKEIPLSDPPGDQVGDPQGDVIGDPQIEEPRTRSR